MSDTRCLSTVRDTIRANWCDIVARSGVRREALRALPAGAFRLFGTSTKTELGTNRGVLTGVIYLSPANEAFDPTVARTLCPAATSECKAVCLGAHSGRMIMRPSAQARLWKSALFLGARRLFFELAEIEAHALARRAARFGLLPAARVDGSSDTGAGAVLAARVPVVHWYDYTKNVRRLARALPTNYSLTLSYSGKNGDAARAYLRRGGCVAVVFDVPKGTPLPAHCWGFPVVDGDLHDARFLDPPGVIIGLRFKTARNKAEGIARAGSFVVRVDVGGRNG